MEINFNIAALYRLTFGHDEKAGKNTFAIRPIDNNHCLQCSGGGDIEADPMRVWAYYQVGLEPYEGGMKAVFHPASKHKLICNACKMAGETPTAAQVVKEVQPPPTTPKTAQAPKKRRGGRKPGAVNKKRRLATTENAKQTVTPNYVISTSALPDMPTISSTDLSQATGAVEYDPAAPVPSKSASASQSTAQASLDMIVQNIVNDDFYTVLHE